MLLRPNRVFSRWQASGLHLCASFTLAVLAGLLIFGVWYPQPYTQAAGADRLVMLLIGIDLILGPLLTLIVYKHGKKGMAFDILFIASVQLAALGYGLNVISESRPVFVVVSKDVTYLTSASGVSDADLAEASAAQFQKRSWLGPVLVAAPEPETAAARDDVLMSALAGRDINARPKYFRPFDAAAAELLGRAPALQRLADLPQAQAAVTSFVADLGIPIEQLCFQPLRGRDPERDMTLVFDRQSRRVVGALPVDPWPAIEKAKAAAP